MNKKLSKQTISFMLFLMIVGCSKDESDSDLVKLFHTEFSQGKDGWESGFAEYNGKNEDSYELKADLTSLPEPLNIDQQAYMLSGMNRSDDLFMYLKKQLIDLKPSTTYRISCTLHLASNAMSGGVGAGGAPGEAVGVGFGAVALEPEASRDDADFYRMNIDKINQCCTDGRDMVVIGNVANGESEYTFKMLERTGEFTATTDDQGRLWIIIGTDSGYEGKTTLYYSDIRLQLTETTK